MKDNRRSFFVVIFDENKEKRDLLVETIKPRDFINQSHCKVIIRRIKNLAEFRYETRNFLSFCIVIDSNLSEDKKLELKSVLGKSWRNTTFLIREIILEPKKPKIIILPNFPDIITSISDKR